MKIYLTINETIPFEISAVVEFYLKKINTLLKQNLCFLSFPYFYNREQHDSSVVLAVSQVSFLWQLDDKAFFPVPRKFILLPDLLKEAVEYLSGRVQICFHTLCKGVSPAAGRFNSSEKCSSHLLGCSWTVARGFPCLSLTGLSVCWYLPANFRVMSYRPFMFLCAAASSACLARLSM